MAKLTTVLVGLSFVTLLVSAETTVSVDSSVCDKTYHLDSEGPVTVAYNGSELESHCALIFTTDDNHNKVCITVLQYDNQCKVELEYHEGQYHSYDPDELFCNTPPDPLWCSQFTKVIIVLYKKPNTKAGDVNIWLQVGTISTKSADYNPTVISISLLIGAVVAASLVVIILMLVASILYYRRQRAQRPRKYKAGRTPEAGGKRPDDITAGQDIPMETNDQSPSSNWLDLDNIGQQQNGTVNPAFEESAVENLQTAVKTTNEGVSTTA